MKRLPKKLKKQKNYLTNIIFQNLKKIKPDTVYTHYEYDLNIDHYQTFLSTYIACRPNKDFRINKLLSFEIPSSTDWGIGSNGRVFKPNYFVDIKKLAQLIQLKVMENLIKYYDH